MKPLQSEYDFYLGIRDELTRDYDGSYVAIKGQKVLGIFDDYGQAAVAVYAEHQYGTVLMQQIGHDYEYFTGIFPVPED